MSGYEILGNQCLELPKKITRVYFSCQAKLKIIFWLRVCHQINQMRVAAK